MQSFSKQRKVPFIAWISLIFVGLSFLVKLAGILWLNTEISQLTRDYSYVGDDYPEVWPIERKSILMAFDNPKHFRLDAEDGAAEWAALVPQNGVVHLGPYRQPFTISMMHQLKCLDILRQEMARERPKDEQPSVLSRHCLNYVRQMVMCHGDLELESFQFASHKNPIDWHGVYECKDWEAVYNEVKWNQAEHGKWLERQTT